MAKSEKEQRIIDECIRIFFEYHIDIVKYYLDGIGSDSFGVFWWIYFKTESGRTVKFDDVIVDENGYILSRNNISLK